MGPLLAKWIYPHFHNNHKPYAIRHQSLFVFVVILAVVQVFVNTLAGDTKILGYATSISKGEIIKLTNIEREANGASTLVENSALSQAASLKADHMFKNNYWAHFAPDGTSPWYFFDQFSYSYTSAGENLAKNFQSSSGVLSGWMASTAGHRENILNSNFTEIGVGVKNGMLLGEETTLVVQFFGKPVSYTASAPEAIPPASGTGATVRDTLNIEEGEAVEVASFEIEETPEIITRIPLESVNLLGAVEDLSSSQKASFGLLFVLGSLFAVDSAAIYKKRHHRENSHSSLHASVILILMLTLVAQSVGSIV